MKSALTFTETLQGHLSFGEHDCQLGATQGVVEGNKIFCHLDVNVGDVERFHRPPQPDNPVSGWVYSSALGQRLPIERGSLRFFVEDKREGAQTTTYQLQYRLFLHDDTGHPLTVVGVKTVGGTRLSRIWRDATTVCIYVLQGDRFTDVAITGTGDMLSRRENDSNILAAGIVEVRPLAFVKQLTTFRATDYRAVTRFCGIFTKRLLGAYVSARTPEFRRKA